MSGTGAQAGMCMNQSDAHPWVEDVCEDRGLQGPGFLVETGTWTLTGTGTLMDNVRDRGTGRHVHEAC